MNRWLATVSIVWPWVSEQLHRRSRRIGDRGRQAELDDHSVWRSEIGTLADLHELLGAVSSAWRLGRPPADVRLGYRTPAVRVPRIRAWLQEMALGLTAAFDRIGITDQDMMSDLDREDAVPARALDRHFDNDLLASS